MSHVIQCSVIIWRSYAIGNVTATKMTIQQIYGDHRFFPFFFHIKIGIVLGMNEYSHKIWIGGQIAWSYRQANCSTTSDILLSILSSVCTARIVDIC